MSGIEIARPITSTVTSGIRVLDFPRALSLWPAVVAETQPRSTDMTMTVRAIEDHRQLFFAIRH
jgi:hypothetical protein